MSQPNLEQQLQNLTPAAPGPQVRAQVAAAAATVAATSAPVAASASAPARPAAMPPRVLPLRRVFSLAAMFMCVAAVGLMAWFANRGERAPETAWTAPTGQQATLTPAKAESSAIDILNSSPARSRAIDKRFEVAKAPAFARVVELKGLVTGRGAQAAAGRWQVLDTDDTLESGGTLRVAGDGLSYAVVALQDGSEILVGSGSELNLKSLREVHLNGGRALVRVSGGAAFTLQTSQNEVVQVAAGAAPKAGEPLASFQVTDRVFALNSTDTYVPRWKARGQGAPQAGAIAPEEMPLPKVANLGVLTGSVALSSTAGRRKTVPSGSRVNLDTADWNIEHDMSGLGRDCEWVGACAEALTRGVGQLTVSAADAAALSPIEVGRMEINVEVRDQIALTVIDEYFVNKNDRQLEGKFFFPLPADASISGFAMWIDDRKVQGEIVERDRAREIYEQILREKRDPGLLEWAGGNEFQARVFPIPPKGEKHIRISYTQVLPYHEGRVHYSYPLMSEMLKKNPLSSLSVNVNIHEDAMTADLRSESHSAAAKAETLGFNAQDYSPAQDFTASWIPGGQMPELKVFPHVRADEGGFYMAMVTPYTDAEGKPLPHVADQSPAPRRWLFVIDASGSVTAETWALTRATFDSIAATAGGEDTFNVILFDVEPRLLFPDYVAASGVNFDNVSRQLSKLDPFGASNLEKAFTLAAGEAGKPAAEGLATTVVYLGDGVASAGEQRSAKLIESVGQKFAGVKNCTGFAVGVGGGCDTLCLDGLARQLGGVGLRVEGLNEIATAVGQLNDSTAGGLLTDLTVTLEGVQAVDQYPQVLPNLRVGDQVILTGRYTGSGKATVTVKGLLNGKAWQKSYSTQFPEGETAGGNPFVPRLWAKRHITFLLNQMDLEIGNPEEQKAAIIDASKKYTLITPFTSFLVLESEEDYRRFNVEHNFNMEDFSGGDATKALEGKDGKAKNDSADKEMNMDMAEAAAAPPAPESNAMAANKPMAAAPATKSAPEEKVLREEMQQGGQKDGLRQAEGGGNRNELAKAKTDALYDGEADEQLADRKSIQKKQMLASERKLRDLDDAPASLDELEPQKESLKRVAEKAGEVRKGRYDRFKEEEETISETREAGAAGDGMQYGYRSGGGRRRVVMRGGGSKAEPESIFPGEERTHENLFFALVTDTTLDGSGARGDAVPGWVAPTAGPRTLGEYQLVDTQLPAAIDAQALPTVKQICGRLAELACELAPVDGKTGKAAASTDKLTIRGDAVEHTWLTGAGAKLVSDGRYTLLTAGEELPVKRQAQAGDRFLVLPLGPAFLGYSLAELGAAYDVSLLSAKDGSAVLSMVERNQSGMRLRVTVDTAKGVVLKIERFNGDAPAGSSEFGGYHAVAPGIEAPATRTDKDAKGQVLATVAYVNLTAKAP